jgi:predicted nuclease of predicted toxin-antitoxin system
MKIVVDMNLSPAWVASLQGGGMEALHWSTIGDQAASDGTISDWARANDAIVLTRDLDFSKMLAIQGHAGPSVVQLRLDQAPPERWGSLILSILSEHRKALATGAIITIDETTARVRALPI